MGRGLLATLITTLQAGQGRSAAIPGGIAAVSRVTWLASRGRREAGPVRNVVAAEDDRSALCDRELRACGGQGVESDRPVVAPASATSNLLWRGSGAGRHRRGQVRDRAAAIVVSVAEVLIRRPGLC